MAPFYLDYIEMLVRMKHEIAAVLYIQAELSSKIACRVNCSLRYRKRMSQGKLCGLAVSMSGILRVKFLHWITLSGNDVSGSNKCQKTGMKPTCMQLSEGRPRPCSHFSAILTTNIHAFEG